MNKIKMLNVVPKYGVFSLCLVRASSDLQFQFYVLLLLGGPVATISFHNEFTGGKLDNQVDSKNNQIFYVGSVALSC